MSRNDLLTGAASARTNHVIDTRDRSFLTRLYYFRHNITLCCVEIPLHGVDAIKRLAISYWNKERHVKHYGIAMSKDSSDNAFPQRLREARRIRDYDQATLAIKAGLPTASISHFENGSRKPSFDNLRKLAKALNASTDYLLGRADQIDIATSGDPLFRHMQNISGRDREIAEDFLKVLANKNRQEDRK
ncbi:helix-turn-helix domain-containing protein [Asaia sp. As-1742]|uniref:helix-turn-helix domain-containing protein n=1 Tax=Asaia sp. As-1742 TaxID=2608325 RepID=UPI00196501CA|nr:helix-turn-helix transcriptional regulator [Asaia sp. As-1742]